MIEYELSPLPIRSQMTRTRISTEDKSSIRVLPAGTVTSEILDINELVPANHQLLIGDTITINGELILEGALIVV